MKVRHRYTGVRTEGQAVMINVLLNLRKIGIELIFKTSLRCIPATDRFAENINLFATKL